MNSELRRETLPISKEFDTSQFDCGVATLNDYLKKFAIQNHANRSAKTFVAVRDSKVVGYYTLAMASAERDSTPERVSKGLARPPVPLALIARLAVDQSEKGRGLGKALMKDALQRALKAAAELGCRAVVVHAKDDQAKAFYGKCGFTPSPIDPLHLFLLIKDIEESLGPGE